MRKHAEVTTIYRSEREIVGNFMHLPFAEMPVLMTYSKGQPDRDRQYHLQRALARDAETESCHLRAIQESIADADAGRLIDLETVKAKWVARANNRTD